VHPWLFGPVTDLLLGAGLLYVGVFVLQSVFGAELRAAVPLSVYTTITLVLGAPHYGATLLRVYADRSERHRYSLIAVHASALLFVVYVAGLHWPLLGSVLITLYFTISPWHYSGQNFGVAMLFLRRNGVPVDPIARRALQASFVASFALVFLALHQAAGGAQQADGGVEGTIYSLTTLDLPRGVAAWLGAGASGVYLACLGVFALRTRSAGIRRLGSALCVVLTQALWFSLPMAAVLFAWPLPIDPLAPGSRAYSFMWIAAAHFIQYLWITSYFAVGPAGPARIGGFYTRALLAGGALWFLPLIVFAPGYMGSLPFGMGLAILTTAVVNLHHFALDAVVWKLRDGRVAQILLRGSPPAESTALVGARPWLRWTGWVGASLVLASAVAAMAERGAFESAAGAASPERMERSAARLAWLGRSSPMHDVALAQAHLLRGDHARAREALDRADALFPTAASHRARGEILSREQRWREALEAYDAALALDPRNARAWRESAHVLEALGDEKGAMQRRRRAGRIGRVEQAPY
jgi:hypothetical protein